MHQYLNLLHILLAKMYNKMRRSYLIKNSPSIPLIKEGDIDFKVLYHIKDKTFEDALIFGVHNISELSSLRLIHPAQDILELQDASFFSNSDIVKTSKGLIWDKSYFPNFSKVIPLDSNLLTYNQDMLVIRRSKNVLERNFCFSMLGVHAEHWAHFLAQFLPKLYYMKEASLLNNGINILFPDYKDPHIREIIGTFLLNYSDVNIEYVNPNTEIRCKKLIYIPTASILSNHGEYSSFTDCVIPQRVIDSLQHNLVNPLLNNSKGTSNGTQKVYLARRGTYRCLLNYQEVEKYFSDKGFLIVEPHLLSLQDKVNLFQNSSVVIGPFSSAFTNLMFCQDNTKVLILSNIPRLLDLFFSNISKKVKLNALIIVDKDSTKDIHTSYTIDLLKLDNAYNSLMND